MKRKTVNFIGSTAAEVEPFFDPGMPVRAVLEQIVQEPLDSESDVLRALITVGVRSICDRQLDLGYAAWAAEEDDEDRGWTEASTTSLAERIGSDGG